MNEIGILFKQINDAIEKKANNMLKQRNLTLSQMRFLMYIKERGGEKVPLKDIEKQFSVSQPTVVGIIKRLEEKEFISLRHDEEDRRMKNAYLTTIGAECCNQTIEKMHNREEYILGKLSKDEVNQLVASLNKIYDGIKNMEDI